MDEVLGTFVMIICTYVPITCFIMSFGSNKDHYAREFSVVLLILTVTSIFQKMYLYNIFPFDAIIAQLSIIITILFIRKIKFIKAIFCFIFILTIVMISEVLSIIITTKMNIYISYEQVKLRAYAGNELVYLFSGIFLFLVFGIYKMYLYLRKKVTKRISISARIVISSILLILYLFMFLKSVTTIDVLVGDIYMRFLYISCAITLICYCGYLYMNMNLYRAIARNKDIEKQMEMTQALTDELRRFKHNYLNIIHGFGYYVAASASSELKDYYDQITKESRLISNDNITAIQKISNAAFSNLIITHINLMTESGIAVFINVEDEIGDFVISNVDLCQIMGIFLDNAREAARETEDPKVKLDILKKDGIVEIYLYNTYKESEAKDATRGHGLIYCKNILKKYKKVLHNTYIYKAMFVQQLIIPKK